MKKTLVKSKIVLENNGETDSVSKVLFENFIQ